jgi:hypothetical protein
VTCRHCRHPERPDEHHGIDHHIPGLGLSCYTDEGEWITPADEEPAPLPHHRPGCPELWAVTPGRDGCTCPRPRPDELSAVAPDPWTDPDAAAAAAPPPF